MMKIGNDVERAAEIISGSRRVAVSTGAGISRESGIPTFRGKEGLWKNHSPEVLASREGFLADPGLVWQWYRERLFKARDTEPNSGHFALAELEKMLPGCVVITQNIDNLHRRAGTKNLVELHGNIERFKCLDHSHPADFDPSWDDEPPRCSLCGSLIRPDIVWFGEQLPAKELETAFRESSLCDTFILVGTSVLVQPAASLPFIALENGAKTIEINLEESTFTPYADIFMKGMSGKILPVLARLISRLV
jgi:NAD-dependent deacetylase